jgi:hypothetical protein
MTTNVAELDQAELAVTLCEGFCGVRRPLGMSAIEALDDMEPALRDRWLRAAQAALEYVQGAFNNASPLQ